jgi:hypothetical protein
MRVSDKEEETSLVGLEMNITMIFFLGPQRYHDILVMSVLGFVTDLAGLV